MGGDKITIMVLKVDLQCSSCYKKVKKILCKFPQIRDQIYDEKGNTVTITIVCCNPEKLGDKLCSKGCGVIKSIEIKEPPKPKETKIVIIEKTKEFEKPKTPEKPKEVEKHKPIQEYPKPPQGYCCGQCYEGHTGGPCYQRSVPPPPCNPKPPQGYCCGQCYEGHTGGPCYQRSVPPPPCNPKPPQGYCCGQCYEGHTGGPCYQRSVPPPPCYDNYAYSYVSRCDQYFNDENATGCSIM